MTFVDISNCAMNFANPLGQYILDKLWNDASIRFNDYMKKQDQKRSLAMLYQACKSFQILRDHIIYQPLADLFDEVATDFEPLLDQLSIDGNLIPVNDYMIRTHPKFKAVMGY